MGDKWNIEDLLKEAIPKACCEEIDRMEKQTKEEGYPVFSEQYLAKKERLFRRNARSGSQMPDSPKEKVHIKRKLKFRYLLVAVLLMILGASTVAAYEPFREVLMNIVYTVLPDRVEIEGVGENDEGRTEGRKKPAYVTEGYELVEEIYHESVDEYHLIWKNERDEWLNYSEFNSSHGSYTITSSGENVQDIKIGKYKGKTTVDSKGIRTIFYEDSYRTYILIGAESTKELVKMLESLEKVN